MTDNFEYDVFLSHASADKAAVRELAERLKNDGVRMNPRAEGREMKVEFDRHPATLRLHPFQRPTDQQRRLLQFKIDCSCNTHAEGGRQWFRSIGLLETRRL